MNSTTEKLMRRAALINANQTDAMSSVARANRNFSDEAEAKKQFEFFRQKLFRVDKWNAHSGLTSFKLFDKSGKPSEEKKAAVDDFIRLTLTGSGKSDWVKIINVFVAVDEVVLTVQPTYNPEEKESDESVISHFFTDESTNNFCLQIKGAAIILYVIGLDEKSNTEETGSIIEAARNIITANVGHYLGIQKGEWTKFCTNFLETESEK